MRPVEVTNPHKKYKIKCFISKYLNFNQENNENIVLDLARYSNELVLAY